MIFIYSVIRNGLLRRAATGFENVRERHQLGCMLLYRFRGRGYLDGLDYMKKEPAKAAALISKVMKISVKEVEEQLPTVYNLPLAEAPKVFAKTSDSLSFFASGQVIGEILKSKKQIKAIPPIENTFDDQFVKALLAGK